MGLTFAKSVRFGAVRFNFSGSGIGMSVGVPGLRVGTGPRGAYISGGAGGFRYRSSLSGRTTRRQALAATTQPLESSATQAPQPNVVATTEHDTTCVLQLTDSNSDGLLLSINEQRKKSSTWPVAVAIAVVVYFWFSSLIGAESGVWRILLAVVLMSVVAWLYWRDSMQKLTVLFFDPDSAAKADFEAICDAARSAGSSKMVKAISSTSRYADFKYSAGASQGLKFSGATLKLGQVPGVKANIDVPILQAGRTTLAFYPDRILAFQGKAVGAILYERLQAVAQRTQFVETGSVPSDATVVGRTWKYVNKSGGPDRRFKDNREYPLCAYHQLNMATSEGLDIRLMISKDGGFDSLAGAVRVMSAANRGTVRA
ncbi:DUF4236 domain-containing protein [Hydrogenophaga sp. BPS33]|uniref:DUF4236 domain-containing protein n=1 Tax=Hydrogenophaga sp. BPS33 TaxID=2651974 RepID=UPI001320242E|nr:DUF4236 domain-containing protein [Hydrogenophaga sp. BPS33]QHE87221.1 DUF4236 domain-containing protein [Hydrogenophaga sp. BPS33]